MEQPPQKPPCCGHMRHGPKPRGGLLLATLPVSPTLPGRTQDRQLPRTTPGSHSQPASKGRGGGSKPDLIPRAEILMPSCSCCFIIRSRFLGDTFCDRIGCQFRRPGLKPASCQMCDCIQVKVICRFTITRNDCFDNKGNYHAVVEHS